MREELEAEKPDRETKRMDINITLEIFIPNYEVLLEV
jgi:hypothetical protein